MKPTRPLAFGLLLLGMACRWPGIPEREKVYAAREAGLTLIYENPNLEPKARMEARLQVRVAAAKDTDAGRMVRVTYTSLRGELSALYLQKNGGLTLSAEGQAPAMVMLPEGFPDHTAHWEVRGSTFRVLGRAAADLHGLKLPEGADKVGVWIESTSPQGVRQRSLLLPDIGEMETLLWRQGTWVSVNRLVSRGFTDLPSSK